MVHRRVVGGDPEVLELAEREVLTAAAWTKIVPAIAQTPPRRDETTYLSLLAARIASRIGTNSSSRHDPTAKGPQLVQGELAMSTPSARMKGMVEIAGPERAPSRYLKAIGDPREVVRDPEARYFGGRVEERSLVPLGEARRGRIGLDEWLRRSREADPASANRRSPHGAGNLT